MTDRPILFPGPMVRAILREIEAPGTGKTQTRRVLKPQPEPWRDFYLEGGCQQSDWSFSMEWLQIDKTKREFVLRMNSGFTEDRFQSLPYQPGDRLWVRETWDKCTGCNGLENRGVIYQADGTPCAHPWHSSIHMPRWASRITLDVTAVKVERLQEITCADAIREGIRPTANYATIDCDTDDPRRGFRGLWDSINAKRDGCAWEDNPWIVAVTFMPRLGNIDRLSEAA